MSRMGRRLPTKGPVFTQASPAGDKNTQRETEREGERERQTITERERDRETERQRDREMESDRHRQKETGRWRQAITERDKDIKRERDRQTQRNGTCPLPSPAPGPGASHLLALSHRGPGLLTLRPLRKKRQPPGWVPRGDFHPQGAGRECARTQGPEGSSRVESGDGDGPHPELPFLPAPRPPCCPEPHPHSPQLGLCPLAPLGVWPFSGLCLPPRAGETHSSLCHFPSWAAKGPGRSPPPLPPLLTVFILISSLPPPRTPPQLPH